MNINASAIKALPRRDSCAALNQKMLRKMPKIEPENEKKNQNFFFWKWNQVAKDALLRNCKLSIRMFRFCWWRRKKSKLFFFSRQEDVRCKNVVIECTKSNGFCYWALKAKRHCATFRLTVCINRWRGPITNVYILN